MSGDALEIAAFRLRMMNTQAQALRGQLSSSYGSDHNATLLAADLVCTTADLAAAVCELKPLIEVPRESGTEIRKRKPRWDTKGVSK